VVSEREVKTTLRMPRPLWLRLKQKALDEDVSLNRLILRALEREVKG